MSEWGKVVFYYDYERDDNRRPYVTKNAKGIISKAYKYPGVEGMVLHAYYGVNYFLERYNRKNMDFSMINEFGDICTSQLDDWAELNTAFDVFFNYFHVELGIDDVGYVLDNYEDYTDDDKLEYDLFNCEGSYGYLFIMFTGNPRDGYKLKYAYDYEKLYSIEDALKELRRERLEGAFAEAEKDAIKFFEENATLITDTKEFCSIGDKGLNCVKEIIEKKRTKEENDSRETDWSKIKEN